MPFTIELHQNEALVSSRISYKTYPDLKKTSPHLSSKSMLYALREEIELGYRFLDLTWDSKSLLFPWDKCINYMCLNELLISLHTIIR